MPLRRHVLNITLWGCTCDQVLEMLSTNIFKCYLLHKTWSELLQNPSCWLQNQRVLQIRYTTTALVSGPYQLPQRVIALDSSFSLFSIFVRTHTHLWYYYLCVSIVSPFVCLFVCLSSISEANEFHETFCIRVDVVQTLYFPVSIMCVTVNETFRKSCREAMPIVAIRNLVCYLCWLNCG
jgi:hypothetical protein